MNVNRLRWACRRGMLELDLLLSPFVDEHFEKLDPEDQALFEQLITCEDQDLFAWLMNRVEPDDEGLKRIVHIVRDKQRRG